MSEAVKLETRAGESATWELLRLAAPVIAMMVSRLLMTFIDFVMVSQLGTEAQAAISPASFFVFVAGCLGLGVAHAVQTYVSQANGRGEPRLAGPYAWQSFYIAGLFILVTAPLAATTPTWFGWLATLGQHSQAVSEMEVTYVEIALWSVPPSIICIGLNGLFTGVQRPWITFGAVVASLATNLVGNWVLIFGHWGFPALGIAGAAYATVLAWAVRAAVLTLAMLRADFDRQYNTRRSMAFNAARLFDLLKVGGPTAIGWLLDVGSWAVFMMLIIPPYGTAAMAANNVGVQYMHLSFMPAIGLAIGLCSQVGFAIGAGRPELARLRARVAFRLTAAYMGSVGLLFLLAGRPLVSLMNNDPAVIHAGGPVLIWAAIFQVFDAMAITYMNALRGAGDTRWPALVMSILCWVVFIGGGYAFSRAVPQLGISGPWSMCTLYIIIIGLLLAWRWFGGRWEAIRLFADPAAPAPRAEADQAHDTPAPAPQPGLALTSDSDR